MPTLFARGSDGVVCIYNGADDVVSHPTGDLSRVLFHSSLEYPSVISTTDTSVNLPARTTSPSAPVYTIHNLFAHGRAGIPFIFGYITNLSNLNLAGSVPLDGDPPFYGRFVTMGADATNVVLHEHTVGRSTTTYAARSMSIRVHVTDLLL